MQNGNTLGDVLGMDLEEAIGGLGFDFDGEQYDKWTRFERSPAFDILWDEFAGMDELPEDVVGLVDDDGYPRDLVEQDPIVKALCSNRDRRYRIVYPDDERTVSATGIALYAYLDPDAEVSFADV